MIGRWLKRRFGLHARQVAVRARLPGYLLWLARGFVFVSVACLGWIVYEQGRALGFGPASDDSRLEQLVRENGELQKAKGELESEVSVLERQVQIERATYTDLARQVKELAHENARLREDVALVQAISSADSRVEGVKVSSVRVEPNAVPGEFTYRIVLLQTGPRTRQFHGHYQLVVNFVQGGERRGVTLPAPDENGEGPYQLDFRVHQRIDGTFKVDPDAVVRSVELRVFEGRHTQPKVMQTIAVS